MKLSCHRGHLAHAFQIVSGVVPARTPKEILKNVKLQLGDGTATLIGTDQEIGIRYGIREVETDSRGEVLLPTSQVISILRELREDAVTIDVDADAAWIRAGYSEFRLSIQDPAEFPAVGAFEEKDFHVVQARPLKEMIRRTIFSTDAESTRYALGGVLMELQSNELTLVATDSRRLALVKHSCQTAKGYEASEVQHVVPSKTMTLIERSLPDADEDVRIALHANDVMFSCGDTTVSSRLVEGRFPRYSNVIPEESRVTVDLTVDSFYSTVRQAQIVTDEDSRGVDFRFHDGLLTLSSQSAKLGRSKIELPISFDSDEVTITFDPRYVGDFLRVLDSGANVRLHLIDGDSAAVFRTDDSYTYVVMPLSRDR